MLPLDDGRVRRHISHKTSPKLYMSLCNTKMSAKQCIGESNRGRTCLNDSNEAALTVWLRISGAMYRVVPTLVLGAPMSTSLLLLRYLKKKKSKNILLVIPQLCRGTIVMRQSQSLPVKANCKAKVRNGASQIPLDQDVSRFDVPVGNGWFRPSALYFCVEVRYSSGSGMGKINLKN